MADTKPIEDVLFNEAPPTEPVDVSPLVEEPARKTIPEEPTGQAEEPTPVEKIDELVNSDDLPMAEQPEEAAPIENSNDPVLSDKPVPSDEPIPLDEPVPSDEPVSSNEPVPSAEPVPSNEPIPSNETPVTKQPEEVALVAGPDEPVPLSESSTAATEDLQTPGPTLKPIIEQPEETNVFATQRPEELILLETEQAIDRAVAAPEAPAVPEPEPLPESNVKLPDVANPETAIPDVKLTDVPNVAIPDVPSAAVPDVPDIAVPKAPNIAAPSVISTLKSLKLRNLKVRARRSLLPKVIGVVVIKEAVPLVVLLRQKKKEGSDVGNLVNTCLVTLGA